MICQIVNSSCIFKTTDSGVLIYHKVKYCSFGSLVPLYIYLPHIGNWFLLYSNLFNLHILHLVHLLRYLILCNSQFLFQQRFLERDGFFSVCQSGFFSVCLSVCLSVLFFYTHHFEENGRIILVF